MPGNRIVYHPLVVEDDLPKLSGAVKQRIRRAIESKLTTHPERYGIPLRGELHPHWKLRVGDYRVVYDIKGSEVIVKVIAHRRKVYYIAAKR
jgi:mRNA-degrading endonuclease RelE of RelBE toxin-antitoxin system